LHRRPGRSLGLAAFAALAGPPDLLARCAGRSSPHHPLHSFRKTRQSLLHRRPGRSLGLAAFAALAGPLDLLARCANRSSPIFRAISIKSSAQNEAGDNRRSAID